MNITWEKIEFFEDIIYEKGTNDAAGAVAPKIGQVMSGTGVDTEYAMIALNLGF